MSVTTAKFDKSLVFNAVQEMYEDVAVCPTKEFHFPTGRSSCLHLGYPEKELDAIPSTAVESFAGVGYPFLANGIKQGDTVVDIGSGSGADVLIAALKTGPEGEVYGIDMTPAMIAKAEENIKKTGFSNVRIINGKADDIPLEDASADVVTSNGVFNLVPDKEKAFREVHRILRPGGRIQISDIVLSKAVSDKSKSNPQLWAECIVGAEPVEVYLDLIRKAGFKNVTVIDRLDYFARSSNESTKKAAKGLGAHTIVLTGHKE
ncbi:MAG: methyltransferase domain-containing protein [Balneolaceae bacterium]